MDYENLYEELQPQEKALKDGLTSLQKLFKAVSKERENGDLKSLSRDLGAMADAAAALSGTLADMRKAAEALRGYA